MYPTINGCSCDNDAIVKAVKDSGLFMMHYKDIYPKSVHFKDTEGDADIFYIKKSEGSGIGGTVTFSFQDQEVYFTGNNGQIKYYFGDHPSLVEFLSLGVGSWCFNYDTSTGNCAV